LVLGLGLSGTLDTAAAQSHLRPLASDHWSYDLVRELDMASWGGAWMVRSRPVLGGQLLSTLQYSDGEASGALRDVVAAWAERLESELGSRDGLVRVGALAGADRSDAEVIQSRGGFVGGLADVSLGPNVGAWAEGVASTQDGFSELRSGGLTLATRGVQVVAGRVEHASLSAFNPVLLNGRAGLDGVLVASREPFRFPGGAERLGRFQAHVFVAPRQETPTVSNAWFASYGLSWAPAASLSFGLARTVRFGGDGLEPFTAANVLNTFTFGGSNSSFDDSQAEVSVRGRVRLGNLRLGLYGALAFEDLVAIKEDPAVVAGFTLPVPTQAGLATFGYEFLGIGPRVILCDCEPNSHSWYRQREYGRYELNGELLGAALGGYGAGHYLTASFWSTPYPLFVKGLVFIEDRSADNLLNTRWPNSRTGVRVDLGVGPWRDFQGTLGLVTTSTDVGSEHGVHLTLRALDVFGLLSRQ
ncbi:MAG: capsule assembly Wzi family protein, partial [Longimicrobiales bacterium]